MGKFTFLKTYFSPFKPLKCKWYFGKVAIGTPIFYPRKWKSSGDGTMKPVPKRIGFDFVGLGWKTKWSEDDFRFEWAPVWSFVFFKWQIAVIFRAPNEDHYWECWLYYELMTDKSRSVADRLKQAREEFPCVWTRYVGDGEISVDYWGKILKSKYV